MKTLTRLQIIALFAKIKENGKMHLCYSEGKCLMLSPTLFDLVKEGKIKSIGFADSTEVITTKPVAATATEPARESIQIPVFKVVPESIVESNLYLIEVAATIKKNALTQADIDLAKQLE